MLTLCFLHGFLGTKEDWDPIIRELETEFYCHAIDYAGLSLQQIKKQIHSLNPAPQFFIGYSMGGRILLNLKLSPCILFSSHPGLQTEQERQKRWESDLKWIEMLQSKSFSEFLEAWYAQELFVSLKENKRLFETVLQRRKQQDAALLAQTLTLHSLAHDLPSSPAPETLFVYGEKDLKFQHLYLTLPSVVQIKKIEHAGHALHLENPKACSALIRGFIHERT